MVRTFDVVSFGSAVLDAFITTGAKERDGNIMIPYGCKILMKDLFFEIGGGGTNTAVAFSRLGLKTGYVGKVGTDKNGEEVTALLKKEKVAFLGKRSPGETSGFSVVLLSRARNRSILTHKGINDTIAFSDVKPFKTSWLYLSSLLEESFKTQLMLARKLKKEGTRIAFNPSEYQITAMNLKPLLRLCDIVILNKEEATLLAKGKDKLRAIQKLGPRIVVVTDERRTIYAREGGATYEITPPRMKIVDKTGAGDAFAAAFVAGIIRGKDIPTCLALGVEETRSILGKVGAKNDLMRKKVR